MKKEWKEKFNDIVAYLFSSYRWEDRWHAICAFYNPRQKWVMNNITDRWMDKPVIIETVLFNCIIHYIEQEKALEIVVWDEEEKNKLLEIYYWARNDRAAKIKEMEGSYPPLEEAMPEVFGDEKKRVSKRTYEEMYGKVNELEEFINKKDTEYMTWLVKNRALIWS